MLEIIVVAVLALAFLATTVTIGLQEDEHVSSRAVAGHLGEIARVTDLYAQLHEADLLTALTATGAATNQKIVMPMEDTGTPPSCTPSATPAISATTDAGRALARLVCPHNSTGIWPQGLSANNRYDQKHYVLFARAATNLSFDTLVFTYGGEKIPTSSMTQIVRYTSGLGGFLSGDKPYDTPANTIHGAFGSWTLPVTQIPVAQRPTDESGFATGHLVYRLGTTTTERPSWLSRNSDTDDVNTMESDLFIRDKNLVFKTCSAVGSCEIRVKALVLCDEPGKQALGERESQECAFLLRESAVGADLGKLKACRRDSSGNYVDCVYLSSP